MSFEPALIVTSRDAPDLGLVVEAKLSLASADSSEQQLKRYMFGMRCPVGMVITPGVVRLYRDTYREHGIGSIDLVGEFPAPKSLSDDIAPATGSSGVALGLRLEEAIQSWLEQLARGSRGVLDELSPGLREAIEEHVLPILAQGEIRAAGPRWRRTGS
jgi:hypothetical protein